MICVINIYFLPFVCPLRSVWIGLVTNLYWDDKSLMGFVTYVMQKSSLYGTNAVF